MEEVDLYCSDGHYQTAIAKYSNKKWTIFGMSNEKGEDLGYKKVLFDTTFDDIITFNSMSGLSYIAVKKAGLWGLIRFRQDPKAAFNKEFFEKALGNEPIDKNAVDAIGREIKLIEEIKYPDISFFKDKYHLDDFKARYYNTEDDKHRKIPETKWEWSDTIIEMTKDAFYKQRFCSDTVRMKRNDGSLGFIPLLDAISDKYNVHHDDDDIIEHYNSVPEMIDDGWVID